MRYYLRRATIGPQTVIEIDEARYTLLKQARKTLIDAGSFEERYELLLGNFAAFEMYCAGVALRNNLELDFRYEAWAAAISEANRHAINFLATTRQYADQVKRDFKHLDFEESFEDCAKRLLSEAYDGSMAYRFVCELRNYVQHRASAVHGLKGRDESDSWLEGSMFYAIKKRIVEDKGKFKQRVLDELEDRIDLLAMFREYIASMSRVQIQLRKHVQHRCEDAREAVQEACEEFTRAQVDESQNSKTATGLQAVKGSPTEPIDPVPLMLDWDDARIILAKKNMVPIRLSNP